MANIGFIADNVKKKKQDTQEEIKDIDQSAAAEKPAESDSAGSALSSLIPSAGQKDISTEQALTMGLIATLPSLLGYAVGGSAGGAAGAQAGGQGVQTMTNYMQSETAKAQQAKEYALKEKHMNTEEMFKKGELSNKQRELAMKEKELTLAYGPNSAKNAGKALAAEQTDRLASNKAALAMIDDLKQTIGSNNDYFGPVAGRLSGLNVKDSRAQGIKALSEKATQVIGKALEGGKLTDADVNRYRHVVPQLSDSPETAMEKVALLERMIHQRNAADIETFQQAGLNVANFGTPQTPNDIDIHHPKEKGKGKGIELGTKAYAAPPPPDFHKMSDEELKKYLGQ